MVTKKQKTPIVKYKDDKSLQNQITEMSTPNPSMKTDLRLLAIKYVYPMINPTCATLRNKSTIS